jgi:predicted nucleic acid-binding protein
MNVVDSSAWLSYFAGDANAQVFAQPIQELGTLLVPSITITEVFKYVCRNVGENDALSVVAHMQQGKVIDLDAEIALSSGNYGLKYKLPLADSVIYATANRYQATVWTQDADFEGLPNVKYFPKV